MDMQKLTRWRLILGKSTDESFNKMGGPGFSLSKEMSQMDEALASIYDETENRTAGKRSAGQGGSAPVVAKWLSDIRSFFTEDVVSIIQSDAIERKGLTQLLFEPEVLKNVQPNMDLVRLLMTLKNKIPVRARETARQIVQAVVEEIKKKIETELKQAVRGAVNRKNRSPIPSFTGIDWKRTISRNLKNYDRARQRLIPERFYFFGRAARANSYHVIVAMDQSGSMADSIVYGSVMGSILSSMPSLSVRITAFDTQVVDLSEQYGNDPVDMIFGVQLGGGTDINKAVAYCQQFIVNPSKTIFIVISDLYEGGNQESLVRRMQEMREAHVKVLCLLALSDNGTPSYDDNLARKLNGFGIPCFACTPRLLPDLLAGAIKGDDLAELVKKMGK